MAAFTVGKKASEHRAHTERLYFRLSAVIEQWRRNRRGRKELAGLPDLILKDLGISRGQVEQEIRKPFWKS